MNRWRALLPGLWLGLLLCVAGLATPSLFALLTPAQAGPVAGRMLAQEAYVSLAFGALLLGIERLSARRAAHMGRGSQFSLDMMLALGTLFCTVAGYFAIQPWMEAAKSGQGPASFAQLHIISVAFYGLKCVIVAALAWRGSGRLNRSDAS